MATSTCTAAMALEASLALPISKLSISTRNVVSIPSRRSARISIVCAAVDAETAANASGDSVVPEVASLPEAGDTESVSSKRKPSPLEKGGTLSGKEAAGKAPGLGVSAQKAVSIFANEKFSDPRWKDGTWDLTQFASDGKIDWDAVIDAEVIRRQWLEQNPQSSSNEEPVVFETSTIPWWAWVRRFHLPEAEKLNGRAAMVGYFMAYVVDSATGAGLVDQQSSFLGKLLLFISVLGVLVIRKNEDVSEIKNLANEWTFYDKQWQATWKEGPPPANRSDE